MLPSEEPMKRLSAIAVVAIALGIATTDPVLAQSESYASVPPLPQQRGNIAKRPNQHELGQIAADSGMFNTAPQTAAPPIGAGLRQPRSAF